MTVAAGDLRPQPTPKWSAVVSCLETCANLSQVHGLAAVGSVTLASASIFLFTKTL